MLCILESLCVQNPLTKLGYESFCRIHQCDSILQLVRNNLRKGEIIHTISALQLDLFRQVTIKQLAELRALLHL